MSTLVAKAETLAVDVSCTRDALSVTLSDGRVLSVPLTRQPVSGTTLLAHHPVPA